VRTEVESDVACVPVTERVKALESKGSAQDANKAEDAKKETDKLKSAFEKFSLKLGPTPMKITACQDSLLQLNAMNLDAMAHRSQIVSTRKALMQKRLAQLAPLELPKKKPAEWGSEESNMLKSKKNAPARKNSLTSVTTTASTATGEHSQQIAGDVFDIKMMLRVRQAVPASRPAANYLHGMLDSEVARIFEIGAAGAEKKSGDKGKKCKGLKVSEDGYKVRSANGRAEEISRHVKSLLNKICPDNLSKITNQLAKVELWTANELLEVIQIIFRKALDEPHYCPTYADMVNALQSRYPQFPPEQEGDGPVTFLRVLLNTCQLEFERLPATLDVPVDQKANMSQDEVTEYQMAQKKKFLANMKFIGNLFLRKLLSIKVMGSIVEDLIGRVGSTLPEEHKIECVCELLQAIGYTIDSMPQGSDLMSQFCARLVSLKSAVGSSGKAAYSRRIQFQIQDLMDLRSRGWEKKQFKEQAKTKDEVRREAEQQIAKGKDATLFAMETAGVLPDAKVTKRVAPKSAGSWRR